MKGLAVGLVIGVIIGVAVAVPATYFGFPRTVTTTATVTTTVVKERSFTVHLISPPGQTPAEWVIGVKGHTLWFGTGNYAVSVGLSTDGKVLTIKVPPTGTQHQTYLFEATLKHGNQLLAEGQKITNVWNTTEVNIILTWKTTPNPDQVTDIYIKVTPVTQP